MSKNNKIIIFFSALVILAGIFLYLQSEEDTKTPPAITLDTHVLQGFSKQGEYDLIGWDGNDEEAYDDGLREWKKDNNCTRLPNSE